MKKIFLSLILALIGFTAPCQLLWQVSGNGLSRPSYVVGTHHFAPASMIDSIPGLPQAIQDCDMVYGEVEKDSLMSQAVQMRIAQAMMAPADSTLDQLLSPEGYKIVEQIFNKYFAGMGVTLDQLKMLKPNGLSTQMQALQAIQHFPNFDPNGMIDVAVQSRANALGKPLGGLETVDSQIDLLFNTPLSTQAADLLETCKKDDMFEEISSMLSEAYMRQDLGALEAIFTDPEIGDDAEALDRLIYNRNRSWAAKLTHILPERSVLVCVGAGHLPGDQGLLQLLRNAGYTVTPVTQ